MKHPFGRHRRFLNAPRILSPSLCFPSFIPHENPVIHALAVAPRGKLDRESLTAGFYLSMVGGSGFRATLETLSVDEVEAPAKEAAVARVLRPIDRYSFYQIRLTADRDVFGHLDPGRRFLLFNILHPRLETSRHSVALIFHAWRRFRFCFIADTHVAAMWDQIERDFSKLEDDNHGFDGGRLFSLRRAFSRQSFQASFINPNRNLAGFIREANALAAQGHLDLILLGGDAVDFQFSSPSDKAGGAGDDSNFGLFERIITGEYGQESELQVPLFAIPGNHDYRLYPYDLHHYPLDRCGLHDDQRDYFLLRARGKGPRLFSFREIRAVLGRGGKRHPLEEYLIRLNPQTDFVFQTGRTKFICLDSGRDVFRRLTQIPPRRWRSLFHAALQSWFYPNSEGLSNGQTRFLASESRSPGLKNLVLVLHAGTVNTSFHYRPRKEDFAGPEAGEGRLCGPHEYHLPVSPGELIRKEDRTRCAIALENRLMSAGLNRGGLFQNQLSLWRAAAGRINTLCLSGHFHRSFELRLERRTGELFNKDYTAAGLTAAAFEKSAYFLAGNALAHVQCRYDTPGRPEFVIVEIEDDKISLIRKEPLRIPPLDFFRFHALGVKGDPPKIVVSSELTAQSEGSPPEDIRMIITFIVFAGAIIKAEDDFPFEIVPEDREGMSAFRQEWVSRAEVKRYFGRNRAAICFSFLCRFRPERRFLFRSRRRFRGRREVITLVECLAHDNGTWKSRRTAWHPLSIFIRP